MIVMISVPWQSGVEDSGCIVGEQAGRSVAPIYSPSF